MENYLPLLQSTTLFCRALRRGAASTLLIQAGGLCAAMAGAKHSCWPGRPAAGWALCCPENWKPTARHRAGARMPITQVEPGGVFGDVLGGSSLASPVTVLAATACEVLLVPYEQLLLSDGSPAHQRVLQNLVRTISDKYFLLSRRVDLLVLKSLRAKVCAYLLSESEQPGSLTFSIPFSRIQLADYLNCDRSALSRELSLMQRDGLLDTYSSASNCWSRTL